MISGALNISSIRQNNLKTLYYAIYKYGPVSKRELQSITSLSWGSISTMVEELLDFSRLQNGRIRMECRPLDLVAELTDAVLFCEARIRQEGLKDGDDLQSYFVSRIEKWLHARGREMIGWDELLEGGVTPSTIVMSWRGAEGGIKAAKLGNRVVMSPRFYFYLDYYQTSDPESNGEPLSIGRNIPIRKLYGYDPFDELDEAQGRNILGIQANLWTEYVATMDHAEYMLLPRLAAMSEVAWAPRGRDYDDFVRRLGTLRGLYDREGYRYADFVFRGIE